MNSIIDLVNRGRAVMGKKPLKDLPVGTPGDLFDCPMQQALGSKLDITYHETRVCTKSTRTAARLAREWRTISVFQWVVLPKLLHSFIQNFDKGKYKKYIRGSAGAKKKKSKDVGEGKL